MRLEEFAGKGGFLFLALPIMLLAWPVGVAMYINGISLFYSFTGPVLATIIFLIALTHWHKHQKP